MLTRLANVQLLIIDDFLLTPRADWERRDLLEMWKTATSRAPPLSLANIGDPTLADAICDRLLHNAYKIELQGDSMRKD